MARTDIQINIRIPGEMKAQLDAAAADNRRSLTAEIVARLDASFAPSGVAPDSEELHRLLGYKDALTGKMLAAQTRHMQAAEQMRAGELSGAAMKKVQQQRATAILDVMEIERELSAVLVRLEKLYKDRVKTP